MSPKSRDFAHKINITELARDDATPKRYLPLHCDIVLLPKCPYYSQKTPLCLNENAIRKSIKWLLPSH